MKFELKLNRRNTPSEELLADLKRVAVELGQNAVTIEEYNERGEFHSTTLTRRFKCTWLEVLELAGLGKTRNIHITDEEYFQNLQEVWLKLGRQPKYREMVKPLSKYVNGAYEHRFGSWNKALERFIESINNEETISAEQLETKSEILNKHRTKRDINWRLRFIVMRRDNFKCRICGRSPANDPSIELHIDHIISWDKGGETVLENLQTLCSVCNIGKSNLDFSKTTT